MIYLKENGEKTQNNFDSLKLFLNVSIPFFSHVVYIHGTKEPACCGNP